MEANNCGDGRGLIGVGAIPTGANIKIIEGRFFGGVDGEIGGIDIFDGKDIDAFGAIEIGIVARGVHFLGFCIGCILSCTVNEARIDGGLCKFVATIRNIDGVRF